METLALIADSANLAAPAPVAESAARVLRRELHDAIWTRRAADERAAEAAAIAHRAEDAKTEAAMEAERLKAGLDAAQRDATMTHAAALAEAFRHGQPLPSAPALPEGDSEALSLALARLNALHQAASSLASEAKAAQDEAAAATAACHALVGAIVFGEAPALAAEAIAAIELHWRIIDRLRGLVLIDEARPGGPQLRGFQEELLQRIDRRKAIVSQDPRYIEQQNWTGYLSELSDVQKRAWLDYADRLMNDADATFGEALPQ
jgi:hypothetical protein